MQKNTPPKGAHECEAHADCAYWAFTQYERGGEKMWVCSHNSLAKLDGWKVQVSCQFQQVREALQRLESLPKDLHTYAFLYGLDAAEEIAAERAE